MAFSFRHLFRMIKSTADITFFASRVCAAVPFGRDDVDAVVSGVLRCGVPVSIMSQVSQRVQALKSCEAFYGLVRRGKR